MPASDSGLSFLTAKRNSCPGGLLLISSNICKEVRSAADFDPFSQDSLMCLLMPADL